MPWYYSQRTGQLKQSGLAVATGYSGSGVGRNNPEMQHVPNVGPIPRGEYRIEKPQNSARTGPHAMALSPMGHKALGRSAFQIHGDNRTHTASTGCIILPRDVRERISGSGDNRLFVTE
jgi:hypothetical protein